MAQNTMRRDHELHGRRRGRNLGVLAVLVAMVVMLFLITVVKMGEGPGMVGNPTGQQGGAWDLRELVRPDDRPATAPDGAPDGAPDSD